MPQRGTRAGAAIRSVPHCSPGLLGSPARSIRGGPLLPLIRTLEQENAGMIWPRPPGQSEKTPTSQFSELAISSPARRVRFLYRAAASLGVLLVVYAIVLVFQYLPASTSRSSLDPTGDVALRPPEDLAGVRGELDGTRAGQSLPIHRGRPGERHRFRPRFGHDRGQALPHGLRVRGGDVRLRQRWQARPLFRNHDVSAAGKDSMRPEPALPEPRR